MNSKEFTEKLNCGFFSIEDNDIYNILYGNTVFFDLIGLTPKKRIKQYFANCLLPHDLLIFKRTIQNAREENNGTFQCELRIRRYPSVYAWILINGSLDVDKKGKNIINGVCMDITSAKSKEILLSQQEERLRVGMEELSGTVWEYDIATKTIMHGNGILSTLVDQKGELNNVPDVFVEKNIVHPDSLFPLLEIYEALDRGEPETDGDVRMCFISGEYRWYHISYRMLYDDITGSPIKAIGVAEDINEAKEVKLRYLMDEQYREAMMADALFIIEVNISENRILKKDERSKKKLGVECYYDYTRFIHDLANVLTVEEKKDTFIEVFSRVKLIEAFRMGNNVFSYEVKKLNKVGDIKWTRIYVNFIVEPMKGDVCALMYARNINDEKNREQVLKENAERDSLTKLYNRVASQHKIDYALSFTEISGVTSVLFMIDLDDFKKINDSYGHLFGDAVLCEASIRIKSVFRGADIIGRVGGDEFVVFIPDVPSLDFIKEKATSICESINKPLLYNFKNCVLTASVGIALSPQNGTVFKDLYEKADEALYISKSLGKNTYNIYK